MVDLTDTQFADYTLCKWCGRPFDRDYLPSAMKYCSERCRLEQANAKSKATYRKHRGKGEADESQDSG